MELIIFTIVKHQKLFGQKKKERFYKTQILE